MSDTRHSDLSTDGDNNNLFINYWVNDRRFVIDELDSIESPSFDTDSSSGSESNCTNRTDSSSSDIETSSSEDSSHSSTNAYVFRSFKQKQVKKTKITPSKSNYWCLPKELYNREIGQYNTRAQWGYKYYQSAVAVHKLKYTKVLTGHEGCVNSLDFNETGDIIASGSDDSNICLWDWSNDKCLLNFKSLHTGSIFQTKFLTTPADAHIVSSGGDGSVVLSIVSNTDVLYCKIIGHHDNSCNKIGIHHETPNVILSCGDDGIVKNIDIREYPINENARITNILHIKDVYGYTMHLYGIDINPLKPYEFIVNGDDEYVRMYDKRQLTAEPVKVFYHDLKNIQINETDDISISTNRTDDSATNGTDNSDLDGSDHGDVDFSEIISISSSLSYSNNDEEEEDFSSISHNHCFRHITSAVYSYCGTEILASYNKEDICLFDAYGRSNSILRKYGGHINRMSAKDVNFYGPRSDYVVSGSDCGYMFIWDKKTEAIVQRKYAGKTVNVLEGHPHMPTLATSGLDNTIKIWEPLNRCSRVEMA